MDIFFQDPSEIPLPPEEVRIRELRADPWPDGRRVRVYIETDPFQKRPSADVFIYNAHGDEVGRASIIEPMTRKMEFTMHLRQPEPGGPYRVQVVLFYSDPIPKPEELPAGEPLKLPEAHEVDRAETTFEDLPPDLSESADRPAGFSEP